MKISLFLFLSLACLQALAQDFPGSARLFDSGWKFYRAAMERGEDPALNDSSWRSLDLPHDWSIEDLPGTRSPFNPDAVSQVGGGFTTGGTAWYRKTFEILAADKGKRVQLVFEGVYMNADVWLNGRHLGNHAYGYTSFWFDLTDALHFGEKNVLAVQVKNEGQNSRWYTGSGIYRHVWIRFVNPVHIDPWGVFVSSLVKANDIAEVNICSRIVHPSAVISKVKIISRVLKPDGSETAKVISQYISNKDSSLNQLVQIFHPDLWSPGSPFLYTLATDVYEDDRLTDQVKTVFGIRSLQFSAKQGFLLNGRPLKLKGACVHSDNGPLGAKSYDRAEERRVELLKASGFNAVRCAHNPPAPAFLDACDRLGMLVIDEAFDMWKDPKLPDDYHLFFNTDWKKDIDNMVVRDRNHPSVIIWSIGNEIPDADKPEVTGIARMLADELRKMDPTRPITQAINIMGPSADPAFSISDLAGYNYGISQYSSDHLRKPDRVIFATESYPLEAFEYWNAVLENSYVIGDFVWAGIDYIGEASIGWRGYFQEKNFYPWNLAWCGDIDICGWKRPQSFYRDVLWNPDQIFVFVSSPVPVFPVNEKKQSWSKWNWADVSDSWTWNGNMHDSMQIVVYSSCEQVELFVNNKSAGKKTTSRNTKFMAEYSIPYEPGILKAIGYRGGKKRSVSQLRTAKRASAIKLKVDRPVIHADGQDLAYINVELQDSFGIRNPDADNLIHFTLEGPGTIVAVGNANPVSIESYQLPQRRCWRGRCQVIVKSDHISGEIRLIAQTDGMKKAVTIILSK